MPLSIKDFSWTQTHSMIYINIPLKGATAGKVDILSTDVYLKVSFPPYLLEMFLLEAVDEDRSTAKVGNGEIIFTLHKKTDGLWEGLTIPEGDKTRLKEIRERALLKAQEKCAEHSQAKAVKKQEERKYTLEKMMKIEEAQRAEIEQMKETERAKATEDIEAWKLKQKLESAIGMTTWQKQRKTNHRSIPASARNKLDVKSDHSKALINEKKADVPAPRSSATIQINFTPRVFPTPVRESRVAEEEEWLKKMAEARRTTNADIPELKDLKEEERNPEWLKEKGNALFSTGNFLAAISAYNLGIEMNRKNPSLYLNRAACHLKLRNLHKAIGDASTALELLTPAVADNADARVKAHVRRGTAFCQLELYGEGLQDYEAALKIDPRNEAICSDAKRIRRIIQGTVTDCTNDETEAK